MATKTKNETPSITFLRKHFPKRNMGWRERTALFAKGAKVTKHLAAGKNCYRVSGKGEAFCFTYKHSYRKDFEVYQ